MTDLNKKLLLRLPIDPYLYNSTDWWWKTCQHTYDDPKEYYARYQDWMREQGVVIRSPNSVTDADQGIDFVDSESMTLFVLRWA
jgi:hypothetical protein